LAAAAAVGLAGGVFGGAGLGVAAIVSAAMARRAVIFRNMAERYQTSAPGASVACGFRGVAPGR
jgi:hypothetical protein